jgi:hypothetical protein
MKLRAPLIPAAPPKKAAPVGIKDLLATLTATAGQPPLQRQANGCPFAPQTTSKRAFTKNNKRFRLSSLCKATAFSRNVRKWPP